MTSLSPTNLPPDRQREILRRMLTIRRFEERASADYLAGQDLRRRALLYRRGGGRGRGLRRARRSRPDHLDASRPRPLHRQGRRPQPHDGRAVRPPDRLLQGQGRLDAHRRFRHRHARRQRHRRGRHLDHHRRRPRGADGGQGRRRGVVFRRRRVERGAVPRMHEHRGGLETADDLCLREQHVRRADRRRGDACDARCGRRAPPATAFRGSWWTATTCSRSIGRRAPRRSGRAPAPVRA